MSSAVENISVPTLPAGRLEIEYLKLKGVSDIDGGYIYSSLSSSPRSRFKWPPEDSFRRINLDDVARRSLSMDTLEVEELKPRIIEPIKGFQSYFTDEAYRFIKQQKKSMYMFGQLNLICKNLDGFMKARSVDSKIFVDLFADPEYSDWVEPRIRIQIRGKATSEIYDLYDDLFETAFEKVPKKILKRIVVSLDKI